MRKRSAIAQFYFLTLTVMLSFLSSQAMALNAQQYRPQVGVHAGYQLYPVTNLKGGEFAFALQGNYAKNPLEVAQTIAAATRILGIVDEVATADFGLAYGVNEWLELQLAFPLHVYHNIAPTLQVNRDKGFFKLGDMRMSAQFTVFESQNTDYGFGLALIPFAALPTGNADIYASDESFELGALIALQQKIKNLTLYSNLGVEFRDAENFLNLDIDDEFLYGLGARYQFGDVAPWGVSAELYGSTPITAPFDREDNMPIEIIGAIDKSFVFANHQQLKVYLGGGAGLTTGYGAPDYRVLGGMSVAFLKLKIKEKIEEKIEVVAEEAVREKLFQRLYFGLDSAQINTDADSEIAQIVNVIQAHQIKKIEVRGYADAYGATHEYNLNLAKRRAKAIVDYLNAMQLMLDEINSSVEVIYTEESSRQLPVEENRRVEIKEL